MRDHGEVVAAESTAGATALVRASGLRDAFVGERLELACGTPAVVLDLREREVVAAALGRTQVVLGDRVTRTGRPLDLPAADALLGRVVDPLGEPLDGPDPPPASERVTLRAGSERWPPFAARRPLRSRDTIHTGTLAIDAFASLARGASVAIVGPRGGGRSTLLDGVVLAQRRLDTRVVLVSVGEPASQLLDRLDRLRAADALGRVVVVAATDADPPALRDLAIDAGLRLAEGWARAGLAALVLWDDAGRSLDAHLELARCRWPDASPAARVEDALAAQAHRLDRSSRFEAGSLTQLVAVDRASPVLVETRSRVDRTVDLVPDPSGRGSRVLSAAPTHRGAVSAVAHAVQRAADWTSNALLLAKLVVDLPLLERDEARLDDAGRAWLRVCRQLRGALHEPPLAPRPFEEQLLLLAALSTGAIRPVDEVHVRAFGAALAAHVQATAPALFSGLRALPAPDRPALAACLEAFARAWRAPG